MAQKFARAAGGNYSASATWSLSSAGPANTTTPTALDDVVLDASSGPVTIDAASAAKSFDASAYLQALNWLGFTFTVSGNMIFGPGMTITGTNSSSGFAINANANLNPAGLALPNTFTITACTVVLLGDLTLAATINSAIAMAVGSVLDLNGHVISGNSTVNRLLFSGSSVSPRQILNATAASLVNCNFRDITFVSATDLDLSAAPGGSGDCGGNLISGGGSVLTLTAAATQTHTASAGGNFGDATKWSGGRIPLPQDDVRVDGNTTGTLTINMRECGKNWDCTGFVGTIANGAQAFIVYGSWKSGAGMTMTGTGAMAFDGRTPLTITSNGVAFTQTLSTGLPSNVSLTLADAFVTAALTHNFGIFDTASFAANFTGSGFNSSNSNTRSILLGSSTITIAGGSWNVATVTGLTLVAGTSTIIISATAGAFFAGSTSNVVTHYWNLSLTGAGALTVNGPATIDNNFSRVGTAVKTDSVTFSSSNFKVVGTFTLQGNSVTNRILVQSATVGTQRLIDNTGAVHAWSNLDIMDIGLVVPFDASSAGVVPGGSGDCGGNTNITFTPGQGVTATFAISKSASDPTIYNTGIVPLPQDTVSMSGASGGTFTMDMPRFGGISWVGSTGTPTFANTISTTFFGSFIMAANVIHSGSSGFTVAGRTGFVTTFAGLTTGGTFSISSPGNSYTMQDALSTGGTLQVLAGTLITQNFNVTSISFAASGTTARGYNMGTSTHTLTNTTTSTIWNVATSTNMTLLGGAATIVVANASANTRTVSPGGLSMPSVIYTVAKSPGRLTLTGTNPFNGMSIGPGRVLTVPDNGIQTIVGPLTLVGQQFGYQYLDAVASNWISVLDAAQNRFLSGGFVLEGKFAMDDWTPAANQALISKQSSSTAVSYILYVDTVGKLNLSTSVLGTTLITSVSTVTSGIPDGTVKWIRVSVLLDDGAAHNVIKFYLSDDGINWTQLGTTITNAGATSIFNSGSPVEFGSNRLGTTNLLIGKMFQINAYATNLDAAAGTPVLALNFETKPVGQDTVADTSVNLATATITGAGAQVGDGRIRIDSATVGTAARMVKLGSAVLGDYLVLQDSSVTGGPWYAGPHSRVVSNVGGWIFGNPRLPVVSPRSAVSGRSPTTRTLVGSARSVI